MENIKTLIEKHYPKYSFKNATNKLIILNEKGVKTTKKEPMKGIKRIPIIEFLNIICGEIAAKDKTK